MSELYNQQDSHVQQTDESSTIEQFEHLQKYHRSVRRKESFLTVCVFAIGLAGFAYLFSQPRDMSLESNLSNEDFATNATNEASRLLPVAQKTSSKEMQNYLDIDGFLEAGEKLRFSVEGFNEAVSYSIHLGNGDKINLNDQTAYYTYPSSGNFEIKLLASYNGESKVMAKKRVNIDEAIMVVNGALVER